MTDQKKEPLRITMDEPIEFSSTVLTEQMPTVELAKKVNSLFTYVFKDYKGCNIEPVSDPNHPVQLSLIFYPKTDNGKGKFEAFTEIGTDIEQKTKNGSSAGSRVAAVMKANNMRHVVETYEVTQDFVEAVTPLMFDEISRSNNYKETVKSFMSFKLVAEGEDQQQYVYNRSQRLIYSAVSCVNIDKLVRLLYGAKGEDGSKYDYKVVPVTPLMNNMVEGGPPSKAYLYEIKRYNIANINKLMSKVGQNQKIGTVTMYSDMY